MVEMKAASNRIAEKFKLHSDEAKTRKTQLLIISDSSERVSQLRAALNLGEIEITCVSSPGRLGRSMHREYDLAVVDVGPGHIVGMLKVLRSNQVYAEIPVFVECSRISTEPGFAGLLPQYRAMPCCQTDLVSLVRNRIAPAASNQIERGIL